MSANPTKWSKTLKQFVSSSLKELKSNSIERLHPEISEPSYLYFHISILYHSFYHKIVCTAQKMKFSKKDIFSKCDWKLDLVIFTEDFIFSAVVSRILFFSKHEKIHLKPLLMPLSNISKIAICINFVLTWRVSE